MVIIDKAIVKLVMKGLIPKHVYKLIINAIGEIDISKDISKYDCTDWQDQHHKLKHHYYRIRKGDYRAFFYFDNDDTVIRAIRHKSDKSNKPL